MQQPITFCVITVTYNAAPVLQRTLDSVARQSYRHLEHLIIDGASKDDTVAIAHRYAEGRDYPVTVFSAPDKGIYDAMNRGLERAGGDYVVFLNAGDVLHAPDTLQTVQEAVVGQMAEVRPAVAYGDTAIVDGQGNFLRMRRLRPPHYLTWRSFRWGMLVCHQSFYVRTDLARQYHYDLQYRHSADVDWCIRVMKEAETRRLPIVNSHAILSDFMAGGNTKQHHRASLRERFTVMRSHYGLAVTLLCHLWFVVRAVLKK